MGENTAIEWATHTENFWFGCTSVSPGCTNCYAEELMANRYGKVKWGAHQPRVRTSAANWRKPYAWDRTAAVTGERARVFTLSLGDFFDAEVPSEWRDDAWKVIRETPNLDWLILTKRPNLIRRFLPDDWGDGWPNVWLGTSVESNEYLWRVEKLRAIPAVVHFLSCEPLLGPLTDLDLDGIEWVIVGGESGKHARPMHLEWALTIRDQCEGAGVDFLFKQHGNWRTALGSEVSAQMPGLRLVLADATDGESGRWMRNVGKHAAGRELDGETCDGFPQPARAAAPEEA